MARKESSVAPTPSPIDESEVELHFVSYPATHDARRTIRANAARSSASARQETIARKARQAGIVKKQSSTPGSSRSTSASSGDVRKARSRSSHARRLSRSLEVISTPRKNAQGTPSAVRKFENDSNDTLPIRQQNRSPENDFPSTFMLDFALGLKVDRKQLCFEICNNVALWRTSALVIKTLWVFNPEEKLLGPNRPHVLWTKNEAIRTVQVVLATAKFDAGAVAAAIAILAGWEIVGPRRMLAIHYVLLMLCRDTEIPTLRKYIFKHGGG